MLANFPGVSLRKAEHLLAGIPPAMYSVRRGELEPCLTLAELEALARTFLTVFLAFTHSRIAREEAVFAQAMAQIGIETCKSAREPHAHRAGLSSHSSAVDLGPDVQFVRRVREFQRLDGTHQPSDVLEIGIDAPAIYFKFSAARANEYARHGVLAPSRSVSLRFQNAFSRLCGRIQLSSSKSMQKK